MPNAEIPLLQVDAFADAPFRGNPAAVCLLETPRDAAWMQDVAAEMNLSETAFVVPNGDGGFDLRWFTPAVEVPLCGHATLASAHALWETGRLDPSAEAIFATASGKLRAGRGGDGLIWLDFPSLPVQPGQTPDAFRDALGFEPVRTFEAKHDGPARFLVELDSEAAVRELAPDLTPLRAKGAPCLLVTAAAETEGIDYVSRFFAPPAGVDEDPVTGSAHCVLAPFWTERLGRADLVGYQASRRGGTVRTRSDGDRVGLGGRAVTTLRATLVV